MAVIVNGRIEAPADSTGVRKVVHVETDVDQVAVNLALLNDENVTTAAGYGYISNRSYDITVSQNVEVVNSDLTHTLRNLTNSGDKYANTVISQTQPKHACIWFKQDTTR
jgi:hypothetical protein